MPIVSSVKGSPMPQTTPIGMSMVDFHHNVFYYYRGSKAQVQAYERQLENNTTKALINTLEHGSEGVTTGFLEWLGVQTDEKPVFSLQKPPLPMEVLRKKRHRLLLAIVPRKG